MKINAWDFYLSLKTIRRDEGWINNVVNDFVSWIDEWWINHNFGYFSIFALFIRFFVFVFRQFFRKPFEYFSEKWKFFWWPSYELITILEISPDLRFYIDPILLIGILRWKISIWYLLINPVIQRISKITNLKQKRQRKRMVEFSFFKTEESNDSQKNFVNGTKEDERSFPVPFRHFWSTDEYYIRILPYPSRMIRSIMKNFQEWKTSIGSNEIYHETNNMIWPIWTVHIL